MRGFVYVMEAKSTFSAWKERGVSSCCGFLLYYFHHASGSCRQLIGFREAQERGVGGG